MTAVEWLYEKIDNELIHFLESRIDINQLSVAMLKYKIKAKEMEKEQIMEAYNTSFLLRDKPYSTAEKYYKETYESNT